MIPKFIRGDRGIDDRQLVDRGLPAVQAGISAGDVVLDPPVLGQNNVQAAFEAMDQTKADRTDLAGPWIPITNLDPAWSNSTLRYRLLNEGKSVQVDGSADQNMEGQRNYVVGTMYAPPQTRQILVVPTLTPAGASSGLLLIGIDGLVVLFPFDNSTSLVVSIIFPLD